MSIIDLLDEELKIPKLENPRSLAELIQQIAIISEAIGRCEKVLQHFAIAGYSNDIEDFISKHIQLVSAKNELYKKFKKMQEKGNIVAQME